MPAKSEKQKRFMRSVMAYKEGKLDNAPQHIKAAAAGMTKSQILDFLKEGGLFEESDSVYCEQLSEFYKNLEESETKKYGRDKIFNIDAMTDIVEKNNALLNVYEKLKNRGKEIFGYHYNEIILSFIFIKYIKSDEELFKKYMLIRNNIIRKKEQEDMEQKTEEGDVNETTSSFGVFGVGGIPATPNFLAKPKKNDKYSMKHYVKRDINEEIQKLINGDSAVKYIESVYESIQPEVVYEETIGEVKVYEHHIESRDEIKTFILNNCEEYTEKALDDMTYDDLYKLYLDVESKTDFNKSNDNKNIIIGGKTMTESDKKEKIENLKKAIEAEEKKEKPNTELLQTLRSDLRKYESGELNENSKHPALTMLDRIKDTNEKNEKEYFKSLNKGVQKGINEPENGGVFEYDYDKDSLKKQDIPAFRPSTEIDKFVELNRGRDVYDIDFDVKPNKGYLDRLKQQIGEENYKKMQKKAELRKKQREHMRPVKNEALPNDDKDIVSLKESVITGYYVDKYGTKKFLNVKVSDIQKVDNISESYKEFRFDGLGNTISNKTENGNIKYINESKEYVSSNKFYIDVTTNTIFSTPNTTKTTLNEDVKNEFKKILNYSSSNYLNPKKRK